MKILLTISLVLNVVLGVLYFQEKNKPPMERIILEQTSQTEEAKPAQISKKKKKSRKSKGGESVSSEIDPLEVFNEGDLETVAEDMNEVRKDFHHKLGLSENVLQKKEKLMQKFLEESQPIYQKGPMPFNLSFADRRKLIDLEEKLHQDMEKLYGKESWAKYKAMVDRYNQKVLEGHLRGENSSVMMNY